MPKAKTSSSWREMTRTRSASIAARASAKETAKSPISTSGSEAATAAGVQSRAAAGPSWASWRKTSRNE